MSKYFERLNSKVTPDFLSPQDVFDNALLTNFFGVSNSAGIRPKVDANGVLQYIVLITSTEKARVKFANPYSDRIEEDILIYTGSGSIGDQTLSGVNKRIVEQLNKPVPILGFVKEGRHQIRFIGYLFLLRYYQDIQIDLYKNIRNVWVFEFQICQTSELIPKTGRTGSFLDFYQNFRSKIILEDTLVEESDKSNRGHDIDFAREREFLKSQLLTVNPYKFEELMASLIEHTGFKEVEVTKKSGDGGIDVKAKLAHDFTLDLDFYFQVKRWRHSVGRPDVANLRGSLPFNNFGVLISTSHFTKSAILEASSDLKKPINLVSIDSLYRIIKRTNFQLDT